MPKKKDDPPALPKPDLAQSIQDTFNENPALKKFLNRLFLRQSLETGLFLSCFIVGLILVLNSVKTLYSLGWVGDLAFGIALIIVGSAYMLKSMR